ncbi:hypothetical protein QR680_005296 [Steinernema hermaphroditum]|uniref:Ground-like domain-containing protein n=1 Tax=Steinernema hermaphroditum TaxID=289476 RepID=A0AA39HRH7_9BILA|nr:hypothetical protein QR680_005296 [Steinernema hermaphroditum]
MAWKRAATATSSDARRRLRPRRLVTQRALFEAFAPSGDLPFLRIKLPGARLVLQIAEMRSPATFPLLILLLVPSGGAYFFPGYGMPPCRCFPHPMMCPPRPAPVCPPVQACSCSSGNYPQPAPEPTYQIAGGSYETTPGAGYSRPFAPSGYAQPPPQAPYPSPPTDGYVASGGVPSPIQPDASAGGTYVDSMYDDAQNQKNGGDTVESPSEQPCIAYSSDGSELPVEKTEQTEVAPSRGSDSYRRKAHAAKTLAVDPKCNSAVLRSIMDTKTTENPAESKRAIARAATEEFLVAFDVVCSTGDFSYLANSRLFCEHKTRGVTCFAFQH